MFTCHPIRNAETYLGKHLAANDYYAKGEEVIGVWMGRGAEALGIAGNAIGPKDKCFEALRTNRHPLTGESLTQRDARERIAFYDFQCSAPKSVSIAAVTFGDTRLVDAHRAAVTFAFGELERYAARRDRTGEKASRNDSRITGNVVAAAFVHDASRELDAQLHTHMVCANATFDEREKKWFALFNGRMFESIAFAGRVYQAELARRVRDLGYEIREDVENGVIKGFEIANITAADCAKQSTRRAQIEAEIEKFREAHGRKPTPGETHVIATETRGKKLTEITTPEVRAGQLNKYAPEDQERLRNVVREAQERGPLPAVDLAIQESVENSAEHLLERKAVVNKREVMTIALQEHLGAVTVTELRSALDRRTDIISLTGVADGLADEVRITSAAQLQRERASVVLVDDAAGKFEPLMSGSEYPGLGEDQAAAVREIIASRDGVHAMLGRAGAGKTHTLRTVDACARQGGVVPLYAAPTHSAKDKLQEDGFENATTVSQLLLDLQQNKESLRGRMLVVDEAGMLSTKQGLEILQAAKRADARVLLVGDEKQLLSVETGDWLGMLLQHSRLQGSVLSTIRRQEHAGYKEAMQMMTQGRVMDGLSMLDSLGWVHEDKSKYLNNAVGSWLKRQAEGATAVLVAPTWREIDQLNELAREELGRVGKLTGPETKIKVMDQADLTAAKKRRAKNYVGMWISPARRVAGLPRDEWSAVVAIDRKKQIIELADGKKLNVRLYGPQLQVARQIDLGIRVGDTLMLQGTDRKLGVINGEVVTVAGLDGDGVRVRQHRKQKRGNEITLPARYQTMVHGYAMTAEKSQGITVDHAIVAADQLDGRRTHVATSRGRRTVEVHVPEKDQAKRRVPNEISPMEAAVDHVPVKPKQDTPKPERTTRVIADFIARQRALIKRIAVQVRGRFANKSAQRYTEHTQEI